MSKEEISPNSNKLLLGKHFRNKRRWNALPCQVATPVTYLLSEMSEGLSSSQICEPVVYGTLRTCCHQPKIILLIHLGFPSSCVRQRIASQLFCNNTAKIWTDLEKKRSEGWITFHGSKIYSTCLKSHLSLIPEVSSVPTFETQKTCQ